MGKNTSKLLESHFLKIAVAIINAYFSHHFRGPDLAAEQIWGISELF